MGPYEVPADDQLLYRAKRLAKRWIAWETFEARDDLQQAIAIALWRGKKRYNRNKGTWRNFELQLARGTVKDFFREHPLVGVKWDRIERLALKNEELTNQEDRGVPPVFEHLDLMEALKPLKPREKRIVFLAMNGFSTKEIANYEGIVETTVYQNLADLRIKSTSSSGSHRLERPQYRRAA